MAIWCHRWIFIMELYKLKTTQMLYHISRASQRSKEQQNWVSVISPKHFKADGHLKSREKKKLFTFPYLVHKAHLIVLILCIKKMRISCSCFPITHLVIVLQLQNYLEEL